ATAGITFSPAPAIRIVDAFGNLITTSSSTVTAARNLGTAALQGTTSVTAVNGVATFANLSYTKAETITIDFTSGTLTGATSTNIVVSPAAFAKLQLLAPGETAAPGTSKGKSGPPPAVTAGAPFDITVNAVDNFWNIVNTVNDTVGITSSDATATLPPNAALVSGTATMMVYLNTAGNFILTA